MAKSVPKCKECDLHTYQASKGSHWCHDQSMRFTLTVGKHIPSKELSTSPKWCPKRLKESE